MFNDIFFYILVSDFLGGQKFGISFYQIHFVFCSVNLTSVAIFWENSIWENFANFFIFQN